MGILLNGNNKGVAMAKTIDMIKQAKNQDTSSSRCFVINGVAT
jgi:hypothetical protein